MFATTRFGYAVVLVDTVRGCELYAVENSSEFIVWNTMGACAVCTGGEEWCREWLRKWA